MNVETGRLKSNVTSGRIVSGGRLQIPIEVRRELGLSDGDEVRMQLVGDELHITSLKIADRVARAQAMFRKYAKPGPSMVDELIAERRAESERE